MMILLMLMVVWGWLLMNLKMFCIISWVDWCVGKCSIFRLRVGNVIEVMEC